MVARSTTRAASTCIWTLALWEAERSRVKASSGPHRYVAIMMPLACSIAAQFCSRPNNRASSELDSTDSDPTSHLRGLGPRSRDDRGRSQPEGTAAGSTTVISIVLYPGEQESSPGPPNGRVGVTVTRIESDRPMQ